MGAQVANMTCADLRAQKLFRPRGWVRKTWSFFYRGPSSCATCAARPKKEAARREEDDLRRLARRSGLESGWKALGRAVRRLIGNIA